MASAPANAISVLQFQSGKTLRYGKLYTRTHMDASTPFSQSGNSARQLGSCGVFRFQDDSPNDQRLCWLTRFGFSFKRCDVTEDSAAVTSPHITVTFVGALNNRDDLANYINHHSTSIAALPDSTIVSLLYERFGPSHAFAILDGQFAITLYDALEGRLFCVRDRFGLEQLYYHRNVNSFIWHSKQFYTYLDKCVTRHALYEGSLFGILYVYNRSSSYLVQIDITKAFQRELTMLAHRRCTNGDIN